MSTEIWAGEVGAVYEENIEGSPVTTGTVTEVNVDEKSVTVEEPGMHPVEEAAMKFTTLLPYVKKMGMAMPSQKGIVRVLHAMAEFPLGKEKPRLLTEGERQLFHILQELNQHKSVVINNIIKNQASMAAPVQETEVKNESTNQEV